MGRKTNSFPPLDSIKHSHKKKKENNTFYRFLRTHKTFLNKYANSNPNPIVELSTVIIITSQSIHHSPQQWNLGKSSRPIWKTPSLSGGTSSFATNHWRSFSNRTFLQSLPPSLIYPSISLFTFSNNPLRHNFFRLGSWGFSMKSLKSSMISMWTKRKSLLFASRFFPTFSFLLWTFFFVLVGFCSNG